MSAALLTPSGSGRDLTANVLPFEEALATVGVGRFTWGALVVCGLANAADAVEILSIGLAATGAEKDLDITPKRQGLLSKSTLQMPRYFSGSVASGAQRAQIISHSLCVSRVGAPVSNFNHCCSRCCPQMRACLLACS